MNYSLILDNFSYWIEINFIFSLIIYFIFILFYSLFSLPGLIIFFVFGGYAFGILWSYFIGIIAFNIGCFCFFITAKFFLKRFFENKYKKYTSKVDNFIKDSTFEYLIIFRLIPGPPLLIQNIILSFLDISPFKFVFSTLVGSTPYILLSIVIGNKLNNLLAVKNISTSDILTWDVFLVFFIIILIILTKIIIKKKRVN